MAGLEAKAMAVLSFDGVEDALLLKRHLARSPKVPMGEGGSLGGTAEVAVAWGAGDARGRHIFEFVFFLVLLEESLLQIVEVYSDMIAVQIDDVYRTLVSVDIFTVIVRQKSLGDVVD